MEEKLPIEIIDGTEIYAVKNKDGCLLVPVRPICECLGVDPDAQIQKIRNHPILSSYYSTVQHIDCLAEEIVEGWILSINSESVRKYQRVFLAIHGFLNKRLQKARELISKGRELLEQERSLLDAQVSLEEVTLSLEKKLSEIRKEQKAIQEKLFDSKQKLIPGM